MMGSDTLPFEVLHKILVFAVELRGIQRALRLRLVSRYWNGAVQLAMFDSGILDDFRFETKPSGLLTEFVLYKAFHTNPTKPVSAHILVIRQAAECVFEHQGGLVSKDAIENSIHHLFVQNSPSGEKPFEKQLQFPICQTDEEYKNPEAKDVMRAVLAIMAYKNDVSGVKGLLPQINEEEEGLLYMDGTVGTSRFHNKRYPILGYALEAAAMRGNVEMTRIILGHLKRPKSVPRLPELVYSSILWHAARGNQAGTLEIGLEGPPEITEHTRFENALESTTSLDIYKRLLDFRDHSRRGKWSDYELRKLVSWYLGQFLHAAVHGDIPRMEYFRESPPESAYWSRARVPMGKTSTEKYYPITPAAEAGRYDAVEYLLNKGVHVYDDSIIAAAQSGSRRLVQLLLGKRMWNHGLLAEALSKALEREHDSVISLLIEHGVLMDRHSIDKALAQAVKREQVAMARLIVTFLTR